MLVVSCLLFLPGCWGKREVEELAPLIGVGFDLGQQPGTYLITEQLARPKQGGTTAAEVEDRTFSVEASSAREAYEKIYQLSNRIAFVGSLKVIVIGADAAKAGFNDILDFAQRYGEFRRSMYLVITKGKAQDLLNLKLRNGQLPAMSIKNHMDQESDLSTLPIVRLGHYLTVFGTKSTAPVIPVVDGIKPGEGGIEYKDSKEGQEIQLQGAGIVRGDHLVDFLSDQETKGYMWLDNDVVHRIIKAIGIENNNISFAGQVLRAKTKFTVSNNNDGAMGIQYQIKASITVDEVMGLMKQYSGTEWDKLMKEAEKSFANTIQQECEASIQKQRELDLDFLGVGRHIEQRNSKYWKTVRDDWEGKIADFPISLNIQVTVNHSGMSSSSATTN